MSTTPLSVDSLKEALGTETDWQLAERLGIERSTVSQWRRRGGVPQKWHFVMETEYVKTATLAARRKIFGDGNGYYIMELVLSLAELNDLDWSDVLDKSTEGWQRQEVLLRIASYVFDTVGDEPCENHRDVDRLVARLSTREHRAGIRRRIAFEK